MKILKLHGSFKNLGGIVAFQKSLRSLNDCSENSYYHFQTGRVAASRLQSVTIFRYFCLAISYILFPFYLLWIRPSVIEINSSLVPGSFKRDYWYARIASFVAPSSRLILFNHGWDDETKLQLLAANDGKLLRYFNTYDCIIVLAGGFRREILAMGVATPVEVITTAIDLEQFKHFPARRSSSGKKLLFLSRLEKEKGVGELLGAVPGVLQRFPDVEVCIAGTGGYEESARDHPVVSRYSRNIRFCGYVRGQEKDNLIAQSQIFVFPSYSEGCPVSVLEALAAGLPLVYTPVGALADLLVDGQNGIQVQPRSSRELERAILQLLDNPSLMSEMCENNLALSTRFDIKVIHKKLEAIYKAHD